MTSDDKLAAILGAIQTDPGRRGLARDPVDNLFTACPGDYAAACRAIAGDPGAGIGILTGFYIPHATPAASETDGPPGAVRLAATLARLGYSVALLSESHTVPALLAGLKKLDVETLEGRHSHNQKTYRGQVRVRVLTIPTRAEEWGTFMADEWPQLIAAIHLRHLIAIERVGPSWLDGRCYSMSMFDVTSHGGLTHQLIESCESVDPPIHTIGIGDGGNEIGMGKISRATIAKNIPNGEVIACRTNTDHLLVAGVSNWGAHALAAGIVLLSGKSQEDWQFDKEFEYDMLWVMVRDGPLVDGVVGKQQPTVDGLNHEQYFIPTKKLWLIARSQT